MSAVNDDTIEKRPLFTIVRDRREAMGVSVTDLASKADVSKAYVSLLERGERHMSVELFTELMEALRSIELDRRERQSAIRRAVLEAFEKPELRALRRRHGMKSRKVS